MAILRSALFCNSKSIIDKTDVVTVSNLGDRLVWERADYSVYHACLS